MDVTQQDALVRRLVANPQDDEALRLAHASGTKDPALYAHVLERVGYETEAAATAAHWLVEAAAVWSTSFSDAHRAATLLMAAIEKDPASETAAERLGNLYLESGDHKALVALTERRASAVAKAAASDDGALSELASTLYERAGRLWLDAPLKNTAKSVTAYRRSIELDSSNQFAIYSLRQLHKSNSQWAEALPLFEQEIRLEQDPERIVSLYADEADVAKRAGQPEAGLRALRCALELSPDNAALQQQFSSLVLELRREHHPLSAEDTKRGSELFLRLAEDFPGENALLYAACAVELQPSNDRAMQLALDYATELERRSDIALAAADYVRANPEGVHAAKARAVALEHGVMEAGARVSLNAPPPVSDKPKQASPNETSPPDTSDGGEALAGSTLNQATQQSTGESSPSAPHAEIPGAPSERQPQTAEELRAEAQRLIDKGRQSDAIHLYLSVLEKEPFARDATEFVRSQLLAQRKFEQLVQQLLSWSEDPQAAAEEREAWLREAAALTEKELQAPEEAIPIWQKLGLLPGLQPNADTEIVRLLRASGRWGELAKLYRSQIDGSDDLEFQLTTLSELEVLQRQELGDRTAAARCMAQRARLTPDDEELALQAVDGLSACGLHREVVDMLDGVLDAASNTEILAKLYDALAESHRQLGDAPEAALTLRSAADLLDSLRFWTAAEDAFAELQDWPSAAHAADEVFARLDDTPGQISASVRAAGYLKSADDVDAALARLEQALDLAPGDPDATEALEQLLSQAGRHKQLATFWLVSADNHEEPAVRIELRKRASDLLLSDHVQDADAAREALVAVLLDAEDTAALEWLAVDALDREAHQDSANYLARLGAQVTDPEERSTVLMREAEAHRSLGDLDACADRYSTLLDEVDVNSLDAIRQLAPLELERGNSEQAAVRLEQWLKLLGEDDSDERLNVAGLLSSIYEQRPQSVGDAIRVLSLIHSWDSDDFDATTRLRALLHGEKQWERVVDLTQELISVEGDEEELSRMTLEVARIQREHLERPDDAMETLSEAAAEGDLACQDALVRFGTELGRKREVAQQIVSWTRSLPPSAPAVARLETAFALFDESGAKAEAVQVATRLARTRRLTVHSAARMESLAEEQADTDALDYAQDVLLAPLTGEAYATEAVRQAEVRLRAKVSEEDALRYAEERLAKADSRHVLALLPRLCSLCTTPEARVEVYERHVSRCQSTEDRLAGLCEVATVALGEGLQDRAVRYFEIAVSAAPQDDQLDHILATVRDADTRTLSDSLRRVFVKSLGTTAQSLKEAVAKSRLLRRASLVSFEDLNDTEQAFSLLTDAMAAYASEECYAFLHVLAKEADSWFRAEAALEGALSNVSDASSERRLLKWRAEILLDGLGRPREAAETLRQLHSLTPSDEAVSRQLSELYETLSEHRGLARLLEDSILRTRDVRKREQLARRVALLWQNELNDAREAADAWRRVLRLSAGDEQAKAGLARAKELMLSGSLRPAHLAEAEEPAPDAGEGTV